MIKAYSPLFLLLIFSCCVVNTKAQELHKLILTVDIDSPNQQEKQSLSSESNTSFLIKSKGENFTVWANVGDSVLWKAKSSDKSTDPINIIGVHYVSGPRIFTSNTLTGDGTITATIVRGGEEDYVYDLLYTIGSDPEIYTITAAIKTKFSN